MSNNMNEITKHTSALNGTDWHLQGTQLYRQYIQISIYHSRQLLGRGYHRRLYIGDGFVLRLRPKEHLKFNNTPLRLVCVQYLLFSNLNCYQTYY